jgi:uncharacterized membrane protein
MPLPDHLHRHGFIGVIIFVAILAALIWVWWAP